MFNLILLSMFSLSAYASFLVKKIEYKNQDEIIDVIPLKVNVSDRKIIKRIKEFISETDKTIDSYYIEELLPRELLTKDHYNKLYSKEENSFDDYEVREILTQGPSHNRINLTILGDGYTSLEKDKFFSDVERIVDDLFGEVTFKSYLKLFNIYAIFIPSQDSGITDLSHKDTAFGLYRSPRGSKRGIMPGKRDAIESALKLINAHTHYPILIANDDYYGGLGGRYAITTRSLNSGSMVLRHELGHNFSNVGEEYDGGQVYSGANFSSTTKASWQHWLNSSKVYNARFLTGSYVWQNLYQNDFQERFIFPEGDDYQFSMKISSVGWESADDVHVFLDGKRLELEGIFTEDRSFFVTKNVNLAAGEHIIKIKDMSKSGNTVLAFANAYAYAKDYDFSEKTIALFNVFDEKGNQRGYRPMHEYCLMRDMRSKHFCPIDQENIWFQFFKRINLIDRVNISKEKVSLELMPIGEIEARWYKRSLLGNREELKDLRNQTSVTRDKFEKGRYQVEALYKNNEIKKEKIKTIRDFKI